jgi:transcriptional regulator with XRE-family HTH domain
MRARISDDVRVECRRLRIDERMGGKEISAKMKVSRGTLSGWLKDIPLSESEVRERVIASHKGIPSGKKKDRGEESKYSKMVAGRDLSRQDKAKIAEAAILFRLSLMGLIVYGSPFDGDKADWLVEYADKPGKTYRIQVKWAKSCHSDGLPLISLMCVNKGKFERYKKGDFDFIIGYCLFNDMAYVYSFEDVEHLKASVSISKEAEEAWDKIK